MAEERDEKISAAYRELGADEPPRALDEAILAAARRSARPWTRRWAVPLSLAAVVVLSVTVTLRIQHEQPGLDMPAPAKEEAAWAQGTIKPAAEPAVSASKTRRALRGEAEAFPRASQDRAVAENRAAAPVPAPAAPPEAPALSKRADAKTLSEAGSAERTAASQPAPTPEMDLERIAELRKQAKHDEADKSLAEFRKRYADYKIPDAMLQRVERR